MVKYYELEPDDGELEPNEGSNEDDEYEDPEPSVRTIMRLAEHQKIKRAFRDHIDANSKTNIERVRFTWDKHGGVVLEIWPDIPAAKK